MPTVKLIPRRRGHGPTKFNILFLGDGFAAGDQWRFNQAAKRVSRKMFNQRPFILKGMRDKFNLFYSFTPSVSSGITCNAVVDATGKPDPSLPPARKPVNKNTKFKLFYDAAAPRLIDTAAPAAITTYVASLSYGADPNIPACWARGGDSFGMVIVLANDDMDGGGSLGYAVTVSLGHRNRLKLTSQVPVTHEPNSPRQRWENTAAVAVHELAHSAFNLKDEYVETTLAAVGTEPNICTVTQGRGVPAGEYWSALKWNKPQFPGGPNIITQPELGYILAAAPMLPHPTAADAATATSLACGPSPFAPGNIYQDRMFPLPGRAPPMFHTWKYIGLYQGAKGDHCDNYRPAGNCKMRNQGYGGEFFGTRFVHVQFCYVCMHAIVEKVDSTLLEALSKRWYRPKPPGTP